ncbi:MAG: sialidase family protein [Planctomycetaceae bacterium]
MFCNSSRNRDCLNAWFLAISFILTAEFSATAEDFVAVEHSRTTIYRSPQSPSYTCWVGAWTMPDGSLMTCFTQATGPVTGRPKGPADALRRLNWPPDGHPDYDMTGLDLRNVHLRSMDAGKTWKQVSADPFKTCMNGVTGMAEVCLSNGTIIRAVEGFQLPYNPELPQTGFLQRSLDETQTWGKPELPLDPAIFTTIPKRLRLLKDGRLLLLGGFAPVPANSLTRHEYTKVLQPLILVSADDGKTWSDRIEVVPAEHRPSWGGEEFDAAELPNGDLLCVFRRLNPDRESRQLEVRWQGVLKKSGDTWDTGDAGPAPFPHSGHPEVLATREGPILHLATSGISLTNDAGQTWHRLDIPGTAYYPRSVQGDDGTIYVFGHVGGDDAYGKADQSIVMDSFRLKMK